MRTKKNTMAVKFIVGANKAGLIIIPKCSAFKKEFKDCVANKQTFTPSKYEHGFNNDVETFKRLCEEWKEKNNL